MQLLQMSIYRVFWEGYAKFYVNDYWEGYMSFHDKSVVAEYYTQFFDSILPPLHRPYFFHSG